MTPNWMSFFYSTFSCDTVSLKLEHISTILGVIIKANQTCNYLYWYTPLTMTHPKDFSRISVLMEFN